MKQPNERPGSRETMSRDRKDYRRIAWANSRAPRLAAQLQEVVINKDNRYRPTKIIEIIEQIARHDANVLHNISKEGDTWLHFAASVGNITAISVLINLTQNAHPQNHKKLTPLHMSAYYNQVNAVALLVKRGAGANIFDVNSHMPIHYAVSSGAYDAFAWLFSYSEAQHPEQVKGLLSLAADTCSALPEGDKKETNYLNIICDLLETGSKTLTADQVINLRARLTRINDTNLSSVFEKFYPTLRWEERPLTLSPRLRRLASSDDLTVLGQNDARTTSPDTEELLSNASRIEEIIALREGASSVSHEEQLRRQQEEDSNNSTPWRKH